MYEQNNHREPDPYPELSLLSEVARSPSASQRSLAGRVGISLGLTNLLLRQMARKGYVRIAQASWRRRIYAVTSKGVMRKVLLTVAYVRRCLDHYRRLKLVLRDELGPLMLHAESRVALYGTGELAELAYLVLKEYAIEEITIFGPKSAAGSKFVGMVVRDSTSLHPEDYDLVIVAELSGTESIYAELRALGDPRDRLVFLFNGVSQETAQEQMLAMDKAETAQEER